jgi:hypothetical protein
MSRYKGRPVRGALSGFFAGLFIAVDLMFTGTIQTDSILVTVLPIAGLVVGLLLGMWAPFGRAPAATPGGAARDLSPFVSPPVEPPPPATAGPGAPSSPDERPPPTDEV